MRPIDASRGVERGVGQFDHHAATAICAHPCVPAMGFGDRLHDGQSKSGAACAGTAAEPLESGAVR